MDQEITQKLAEQKATLDAIYTSVEKTRRYFLFTLYATIIMFLLPLLGLVFAIPFFMSVVLGPLTGLL